MKQDDISSEIVSISINEIEDFPNHPFKVELNEEMVNLVDSIKDRGILVPVLLRQNPNEDGYQMISGHRRKFASKLVGLTSIPAIVHNYNDEDAIITMTDSNFQRENILPSEKAFAYKMKYDALLRRKENIIDTVSQLGTQYKKKRTDETLAEQIGISRNQIHRYIRLTYLKKELLDMVDEGRISFNPAVELSFLTNEHQDMLYDVILQEDATPSLAQAQQLKQLGTKGRINEDVIYVILSELKGNQRERLTIPMDKLDKYFPRSYTPKSKEDLIIRLLDSWSKKRSRNQER